MHVCLPKSCTDHMEQDDGDLFKEVGVVIDDLDSTSNLPASLESCLAMNRAYQDMVIEHISRIELELAENREAQVSWLLQCWLMWHVGLVLWIVLAFFHYLQETSTLLISQNYFACLRLKKKLFLQITQYEIHCLLNLEILIACVSFEMHAQNFV